MREYFQDEVLNITNQTETKLRGRHTGESPAVLERLRLESSRSDLPSLFNQNPFIMREQTDDKCGHCPDRPITAELIIKDLMSEVEDMCLFDESLHDMFLIFISQQHLTDGEYKDNAILTYTVFRELIRKVNSLKKFRKT